MAWRKPQNVREWLQIAFRHRKKFFFPAVATMILVVIVAGRLPRTYTAEAKFQRFNDQTLEQISNQPIKQTLAAVRRTAYEELRGQPAIDQLVEDLGLDKNLPRTADGALTAQGTAQKLLLIKSIQSDITIGYDINSEQMDQVRVSYTGSDRELVPRIANRVVDNYINKTRQQLDEMLLSSKIFFQHEVEEMRKKVTELQRSKLEFEVRYPDVNPDNPMVLQNRTIDLTAKQVALSSRLNEAVNSKQQLDALLVRVPETIVKSQVIRNPEYDALIARKSDLEKELQVQQMEYRRTDAHPQVKSLKNRLAAINEQLENTAQQVTMNSSKELNPAHLQLEEKSAALDGEIKSTKSQLVEISKSLEQIEDIRRNFYKIRDDYTKLITELEEAQGRLKFYDDNLQSTTIAWTVEQRNSGVRMRVWQLAQDAIRPSFPNLLGIMMVAVILGLSVGVVMIFLAELTDHSFRGVEHAMDELKLPVLGTVNEIITAEDALKRRILNVGVYPAIGGLMILVLLISLALVNMSLVNPEKFHQLQQSPIQFFKNTIQGK